MPRSARGKHKTMWKYNFLKTWGPRQAVVRASRPVGKRAALKASAISPSGGGAAPHDRSRNRNTRSTACNDTSNTSKSCATGNRGGRDTPASNEVCVTTWNASFLQASPSSHGLFRRGLPDQTPVRWNSEWSELWDLRLTPPPPEENCWRGALFEPSRCLMDWFE